MLFKGILNIISSTIITLSLKSTSGGTIITSALREPIVRSIKIVIVKGVKALNKGGVARGKGKRRGKDKRRGKSIKF
jgi:hypothetical protein